MNKIALALILLILPFSLVYTSPRKKVGIVLSGGGAKGGCAYWSNKGS